MYKILRSDGAVLYDVNDPDTRPVTEPKGTFEIGQAGSLQFSLVPDHPLYNGVEVMETFVSAMRENNEIFYGRIIDINVDKVTGIKQIECAGALQFLEDGELPPVVNETPQQEGQEEQEQPQGIELSGSAFFSRCIAAYNVDIGSDPKRALSVGTISHSKASATKVYNITGYTQVKSALETNLISEYGGYFRVRKSGNDHVIDWLDTYSEPNTSPIKLTENVLNQDNAISAGDFFTMVRPIGKDNLVLSPVAISSALVNKYGRIIRSVTFGDAEDASDLLAKANQYIADIAKGLGKTCTVKLVDMHFLDDSIPIIRMGATYTNIEGFENEPMVVAGMELNFANPADDSITLKNAKELEAVQKGGSASRGSLAKSIGGGSGGGKGFQNIWQHITEGEDWLRLAAERIEINAQNLIEVVGTFERYAEETRTEFALQQETLNGQAVTISAIQGTGVLQNSDQITQVAGMFSSKYYLVPDAARTGRNPSAAGWYEAQQYQVSESDIGTGVELFGTVADALAGRAINTTSGLSGYVGQWVTRMVHTADTEPGDKDYYTKSLGLLNGAQLTITDNGSETNIGELLTVTSEGTEENKTQVELIKGSALWAMKDHITGVCGEYEIKTGPDGERTLVIKSGGGIRIRKNNTEFGLFDEDNLSAGIIVDKINDPNNTDAIIEGTRVRILAEQVKVGATSNVAAWMAETGQDINTLEGLVADRATIADLMAQKARIDNITADYITSTNLATSIGSINSLLVHNVQADSISTGSLSVTSVPGMGGVNVATAYNGASISQNGSEYTLTLVKMNGQTDTLTFSKATALAGTWGGGTFNVRAISDNRLLTSTSLFDVTNSDITWNENIASFPVYANISGGETRYSTGKTLSVDATVRYTAGVTQGHTDYTVRSAVIGSRIQDQNWNIAFYRNNDSMQSIEVNLSAVYNHARQGWTEGTFTGPISITPISGSGVRLDAEAMRYKGDGTRLGASGTYYKGNGARLVTGTRYKDDGTSLGASGTYYKGNGTRLESVTRYQGNGVRLGASGTYYKGNGTRLGGSGTYYRGNGTRLVTGTRYKGDGSSVTGRGTSYSRTFYGQLYSKNTSTNTYSSQGSGAWFLCGSLSTVYAGNGSTITGRGTSETVYIPDTSGGYYLRGESVTAYPTDSSGSNYLRGDSVTAYPADSAGSNYLRGTSQTVYVANNSAGTYYLRGDSVTAYPTDSSGSLRLRGTSETVYIPDTSGGYYLRGDSVTAYPTDSSGGNYLRGEMVLARDVVTTGGMLFYAAGTTGNYYTKT